MDVGFFYGKGGLSVCCVLGAKTECQRQIEDARRRDGKREAQEVKEVLITMNR
jgi:hypothetical protein